MSTFLFTCVICDREVRTCGPNRGPDMQVAPICRYCENSYADRAPQAGAFMDRRKAVQISALANCLTATANIRTWEDRYGGSRL